MSGHDLATNGQADARSLVLLRRIKPAEKLENRFMEPTVDTNAVVSDEESLGGMRLLGVRIWLGRPAQSADLDEGHRTSIVFDGVANKICQKLMKPVGIAPEHAV